MTTTTAAIVLDRNAPGTRYAVRLASLQAERAAIAEYEARAEDVIATVPTEFKAAFRVGVDMKREAFERKVKTWQDMVDARPDFWLRPL